MAVDTVPRGTPARAPRPVATLDDILLELIDVGDNVRVDVGELDDLAANIAEIGVQSPVKVTRQDDGRYRLVWGQRRVLASRQAGLTRIPAIIEPPSDVDAKGARRSIEQLSENLQRQSLNAIEEAIALREVLDANPELTQAALADKLGRSAPWVSNTLRLLEADPAVQTAVREGTVSASHAKNLVALPAEEQVKLVARIAAGMSTHDLENTLKWKLTEVKEREAKKVRTAKAIPKALEALEAAGTEKATSVYLQGTYNLDSDAVSEAVRKAGFKISRHYAWDPGEASRCDCRVVVLSFNRSWKVEPGCIDDSHRDRQRNADHKADAARSQRIAGEVDELAGLIDGILAGLEVPPVLLRLLAAANWRDLHELIAGDHDHDEVRAIAAKRIAATANSNYAYGNDREAADAALAGLLQAFRPEEAAKPTRGRKAAAGA